MHEIVIYSLVIILLPLVPAYILYAVIPAKEPGKNDAVEGTYQGLNIKLKGAFAGYFILALFLSGFIGTRLLANSEYEYWTVQGVIDQKNIADLNSITFTIEPPDQQKYPNGRFVIKNVPIHKDSIRSATLVLAKMSNGERVKEVVNLEEEIKPWEKVKKYEVKYGAENNIYINTPIAFAVTPPADNGSSHYSSVNAITPQPISN